MRLFPGRSENDDWGGALTSVRATVHRAHVSTSPSDHAVDLFYVTGAAARSLRAGHAC